MILTTSSLSVILPLIRNYDVPQLNMAKPLIEDWLASALVNSFSYRQRLD